MSGNHTVSQGSGVNSEGGDMNPQDMMQPGMDPGMMGMVYPYNRITYTPQAIACFKLYDKDGYCVKEFW